MTTQPPVVLQGINVTFSGRKGDNVEVLHRIDLEFPAGQITAIVGPSGSGKSTLLNVIAGLIAPTTGVVRRPFNGEKLVTGYLFQEPTLLPWRTVFDNALFGADLAGLNSRFTQERCRYLLGRYGLLGFEHRYPKALSGGMQQRVALIRAVLSGASVLLLDEPFSNSDFLTRRALQADLLDIVEEEQVTVVLVTHDLEEAIRLGDRIVVFSRRPARILLDRSIHIARDQRMEDLSPSVLEPYLSDILETFRPESLNVGVRN